MEEEERRKARRVAAVAREGRRKAQWAVVAPFIFVPRAHAPPAPLPDLAAITVVT